MTHHHHSAVEPPTNPASSVYLLGGLLVVLLALATFAAIVISLKGNGTVTKLDHEISSRLEESGKAEPMVVDVLLAVTHLGDFPFLATLSSLIALGLAAVAMRRRPYWPLLLGWALATIGGGEINYYLKLCFERQRPNFVAPLVHENSFSFPSGHSMGSMIIYGMLAYLLVVTLPNRLSRMVVIAGWITLVLAIGFSRVYLGAHWPSDVIGGYTVGSVWLLFCIAATETLRKRVACREATHPDSALTT